MTLQDMTQSELAKELGIATSQETPTLRVVS